MLPQVGPTHDKRLDPTHVGDSSPIVAFFGHHRVDSKRQTTKRGVAAVPGRQEEKLNQHDWVPYSTPTAHMTKDAKRGPLAHLHVAPAPPYVQRSLRRPLLPLRQASITVSSPAAAAAAACARTTTAARSRRGPFALELVKLAPPRVRLRVEGTDLLQADEAPREGLPSRPADWCREEAVRSPYITRGVQARACAR